MDHLQWDRRVERRLGFSEGAIEVVNSARSASGFGEQIACKLTAHTPDDAFLATTFACAA
jgi:hypothetical protein